MTQNSDAIQLVTAGSSPPPRSPKVAVIVPTFNRWPHVCRTVDSVLAQAYPNVECMVVDDASTDGTVARLTEKYGGRIRLLAKPDNEEKCAARNDGVRATDAQFVCMCDSDDELTPESIALRMHPFLDGSGFDGVSYGVSRRDDPVDLSPYHGDAFNGDTLDAYLKQPFLDNNCYLISRENMLHHGMYREVLTNREDVELLIRLMRRLPFRFCGGVVANILRVDQSARMNFEKILSQDRLFTQALFSQADVVQQLVERCRKLRCQELEMLAWACYKWELYPRFRELHREITRDYRDVITSPTRGFRRYLASYLLQLLHPPHRTG